MQLLAEIIARKKAEDALIHSEKLASVGRMAAVLAHEINNPLEAVTNVLFLAQTTEGLPETARQYLQMADAELKRIAHITRQTLGFYRESSAPIARHLSILLDSVVDLLQAKTISKRAIVDRQCEEQLEMTAFQAELRQVVSNLLMNSLDAIDEGGRITLSATLCECSRDASNSIRITVSDNGQGMSDVMLNKIFKHSSSFRYEWTASRNDILCSSPRPCLLSSSNCGFIELNGSVSGALAWTVRLLRIRRLYIAGRWQSSSDNTDCHAALKSRNSTCLFSINFRDLPALSLH